MESKWLKNISGTVAKCVHEGRIIEIEPGETRMFSEVVAATMLEENPESVIWDRHFEKRTELTEALDADVFLANMTGHPLYPETIQVVKYDPVSRKQYTDEVPFINKKPQHIRRKLNGGQMIVQGPSGEEHRSLAPQFLDIPIQTRKPFSPSQAEWLLRRSANNAQVSGVSGAPDVIRSRPPSAFEPDESWSYDDMLIYCELVDSRLRRMLSTSDQILNKSEHKQKKGESAEEFERRSKYVLKAAAQTLLFDYLFYFLADPRYKLPTREQFLKRKEGKAAAAEGKVAIAR